MSDTQTIREAIRQANMDAEYDLNNSASTLIALVLGLDPQMPVETLKRRQERGATWRNDCETLLTAAMYGNPPGGWSDPERRAAFVAKVADIEARLREES
jgi:hypothetical protein